MSAGNAELVAAVVGGAVHRYAEIVRRFDSRVRQVIHPIIADPAVREDLVQETFYRGFTNLDQLRQYERIESWLVMIARNCVNDHFRNIGRRLGQQASADSVALADQCSAVADADSWIWQEVDQLSDRLSEVLRLRYQQNMAYDEIARHTDVRVSTVRGRIFEARKALRQRLINHRLYP